MTRKLRIGIEAIGVRFGGAVTVLTDLIDAVLSDERFEKAYVFCSPAEVRRFDFPPSDRICPIECPRVSASRIYRFWWNQFRLPQLLSMYACDVAILLSGTGFGGSVPHLTLIQQSLPFSAEAMSLVGLSRRLQLHAVRGSMRRSCVSSRKVLVQTRTMAATVAQAFSLAPDRFRVVFPASRQNHFSGLPNSRIKAMRDAPAATRLLYVGHGGIYKNITTLLKAAKKLRTHIPNLATFLTLPPEHEANGKDGAVCLGYLGTAELAEAYSLADALVMPSLFETVGLPLLEAMDAGTPVIVADRPYAREVCGEAALYFSAKDAHDLALRIKQILGDSALRQRLRTEGFRLCEKRRNARPFRQMLDEAVGAAESAR